MDKLGLVLDGGGGKGAYQIGVWKYLKEVGLDKNIKAVSGASVGALNACLFALDDYKLAEKIWTREIKNKILSIDIESTIKGFGKYGAMLMTNPAVAAFVGVLASTGVLSRDGLVSIINKHIDLNCISNMDFPIYCACTHIPSFNAHYFKLNGRSEKDMIDILLASSAIPILFPVEKVDGEIYLDGGIKDNSPLTPLYDEGCTDIMVIHLKADEIIKDRRDSSATIYEICPQEDLGNLINGTLDFSPEGAYRRIEQGYNDAKEVLEAAVEMAKAQAGIVRDLDIMKSHEKAFKQNRKQALEERQKLKANLNSTMESFMNIEEAKKNYLKEQKRKNLE